MAENADLKVEELKICEDIIEFFELNDLHDLDTVDELAESLQEMTLLSQSFRHTHVDLREKLDVAVYKESYPKADELTLQMREFVKGAKLKLKGIKYQNEKQQANNSCSEKENLTSSLEIEEEIFREQLTHLFNSIQESAENVDELKICYQKLSEMHKEYYSLYSKIRTTFGSSISDDFLEIIKETISRIEKYLGSVRTQISNITEKIENANLLAEANRVEKETERVMREHKFHAENLLSEIRFRCSEISDKCDTSKLDYMTDFQVLDIHKSLPSLDTKMLEICEKITCYSKIVANFDTHIQDSLIENVRSFEKRALLTKNKFVQHVNFLIANRDITEEKLKNVSSLEIELTKFKGYDSKLDIFSFKSEFERLVQPLWQKSCWADSLKTKYLCGAALTLVEKIASIDKIWEVLISAYGNVKILLQNKLGVLDKLENLGKVKSDEKRCHALAKLINAMTELSILAEKHNLENKLYVGGGFEKVLSILGDDRERRFFSKNSEFSKETSGLDEVLAEKLLWEKLKQFLQKELKVCESLSLLQKSKESLGIMPSNKKTNYSSTANLTSNISDQSSITCYICEKDDHVATIGKNGLKTIDYFACPQFVQMSPKERRTALIKKRLCLQCLCSGQVFNKEHMCYERYVCPDPYHKSFKKGTHVLVCEEHKMCEKNAEILKAFQKNVIAKRSQHFKDFTKNISLTCYNIIYSHKVLSDVNEQFVFMFQTIKVGDISLNIFFDSGCGDLVIKKSAIDQLEKVGMAKQEIPGPLSLSGVGDNKTISPHGIYTIRLPLKDGNDALLSGVCLNKVTSSFPKYPLRKVEEDIKSQQRKKKGARSSNKLPSLPKEVGGETDILLGIKYFKYHPKQVWESDSGLKLFNSFFLGEDGSTGVLGGPHKEFTQFHREKNWGNFMPVYFFDRSISLQKLEIPLLGQKISPIDISFQEEINSFSKSSFNNVKNDIKLSCANCIFCYRCKTSDKSHKQLEMFDSVEEASTEVTFRCIDCRACTKCKKSKIVDAISIQEEIEQDLISKCVSVDIIEGKTVAKLPFIANPDTKLTPNDKFALKIFSSQLKMLDQKPNDKKAVIESEAKLQSLGFVDYLDNLPLEDYNMIMEALVRYFIPWRVIWNENSLSTPCRICMDGTAAPCGSCSLNSILAKGTNNLNNLVEIMIRWTGLKFAFHTDIAKMYNAIFLDKSHWRYHLYFWDENLSTDAPPKIKVLKTLTYGLKPSGNLAESGLRLTANLTKDEYPSAYSVIMNDVYVDDIVSGAQMSSECNKISDELIVSLSKGGFGLKGFTFSGSDPPENLSTDGKSVLVGGLKWYPKEDKLSLNMSELNFSRKKRGRKCENQKGIVPEELTRKDCLSKVAEIFDILGKFTPLICSLKLDLRELTRRKLDWDDTIPNDLRKVWLSNFEMIQEMGQVKFNRAIIPENAVDVSLETIDTADASQNMLCVAIYARFKLKSGLYSCQLVFSRSKIVPDDISIPRAELSAALLNASTGFIVKKSFGQLHTKSYKISDSQVALHWINSKRTKLKMWVRNRVIEINRLVANNDWYYVESSNNISDLGTRKGATVKDIGPESKWINGLPWMIDSSSNFPLIPASDLVLPSEVQVEAKKECIHFDPLEVSSINMVSTLSSKLVPCSVGERYKFSNYIIDPNRFRFRKVVGTLGIVMLFIVKICKKLNRQPKFLIGKDVKISNIFLGEAVSITKGSTISPFKCPAGINIMVSELLIKSSLYYFFRKASEEIMKFVPKTKYEKISVLKNGLLYHSSRILDSQRIVSKINLGEACFDLSNYTFVVPLVDRTSPIAYAIINEVHWYHPDVKHRGVESILRHVNAIAHILGGRDLVKIMKDGCVRCRLLNKRAIRVMMGPKDDSNLIIAPAFFTTLIDICGPFDSFSNVNKRAKVKVWILVFCCSVTGATDCRVMEDYSTDSFILSFIRFSCRFGYPLKVLVDSGSQLIKGCKDMIICFSTVKQKLYKEYGIAFDICPVGSHYQHGKVERKIKQIKESLETELTNERLSLLQWETLAHQIANSVNNLPIGLGSKCSSLETLDLLTPNRLLLGRNNDRTPTEPLILSNDVKKIVKTNEKIFTAWFKSWLISYVPTLIERPKWFTNDSSLSVGDVVLFLKAEKEFEKTYQYGMIKTVIPSKDGLVRKVEVEYQNYNESTKRTTLRGVRELVLIYPIDELDLYTELNRVAEQYSISLYSKIDDI